MFSHQTTQTEGSRDRQIIIPSANCGQSVSASHGNSCLGRTEEIKPWCDYPGRTLVLCFDEAGNQPETCASNDVDFLSVLRKSDHSRQLVYYQNGTRTHTAPPMTSSRSLKSRKVLDFIFANSIKQRIVDGYEFLVQECEIPFLRRH